MRNWNLARGIQGGFTCWEPVAPWLSVCTWDIDTNKKGGDEVVLTGQLGQVHWPLGQLQFPVDEHPQSLMVEAVLFVCGFLLEMK